MVVQRFPSSTTRFVEANSKMIADVKSPPFLKIERAIATDAYEQEEEAAPRPVDMARERGELSGNNLAISFLEMTAWIMADIAKPRIRAHAISHNILKEFLKASKMKTGI